MCTTCGCGDDGGARYTRLTGSPQDHDHPHDLEHPQDHQHPHDAMAGPHTVVLEQRVLGRNDELAAGNRRDLTARGILAVNVMSSPGSGKTTLLERTIRDLSATAPVAVLEGDQETAVDAERIRAIGAPVVQVNTGSGCHLDAEMMRRGVQILAPADRSLLFIENVGNLVCPALFDLGETVRVVVMSVTEGDDKPIKYPHMFRSADLVLINKTDLLDYVDFDPQRCADQLRQLNPGADVLRVSATRGEGMAAWYRWLDARRPRPGKAGGPMAANVR